MVTDIGGRGCISIHRILGAGGGVYLSIGPSQIKILIVKVLWPFKGLRGIIRGTVS